MLLFLYFLPPLIFSAEITNIDSSTEIQMGKDALVTVELSVELENEWLLRANSFIRSGNGIGGWRTADGLK